MKNFIYIVLIITSLTRGQNKLSESQWDILAIELSNAQKKYPNGIVLQKIIGDSLPLVKQINHFKKDSNDLKQWCLMADELSQTEADEIFGSGGVTYSNHSDINTTIWYAEDFPGFKIAFFDDERKSSRNNILRMYHLIALSIPSIRSDEKFAYLQVSSQSDGVELKIYKKINGEWILYKIVQLAYV